MGRKIPGRKHRGIRDPEKQRQVRLDSIKNKINTPPTNADNQDIPKSLARIIDLKEKVKTGVIPEKRKRRHRGSKGPVTSHPNGIIVHPKKPGIPEKPTPIFTQDAGETDNHFMYRVNKVCMSTVKEAAFENKYGIDITRNAVTGDVEQVVKRKKDELVEYLKVAKKVEKEKGMKKKKKKKKDVELEKPKLNKSQQKQLKLKTKLENRAIDRDDFNNYKDQVKFGEIVHAPPTLVAPRRVQPATSAPRPGRKDLLLKSIFETKTQINVNKTPTKIPKIHKNIKEKKIINKTIDKTGKRKDLPHAMRRQLDMQQSEVIQAYKDLKKKKYGTNNVNTN